MPKLFQIQSYEKSQSNMCIFFFVMYNVFQFLSMYFPLFFFLVKDWPRLTDSNFKEIKQNSEGYHSTHLCLACCRTWGRRVWHDWATELNWCITVVIILFVLNCFSHIQFFAILWTVALQAPPSMGFSRQEYWSWAQTQKNFYVLWTMFCLKEPYSIWWHSTL